MHAISPPQRRTWATLRLAAGLLAAFVVGLCLRPTEPLAEVVQTRPREAFKAGGERSEIVLREIADLLKKMDGRLERIERVATGAQAGAVKK